jgi:hypothetical protein
MSRRLAALALAFALGSACASAPTPSASVSPMPGAIASPSPSELATPIATPARTPSASIPRGALLVPQLTQAYAYPLARFDIVAQSFPGQPAEDIVWQTDPFRADAGYVARAAATFDVAGTSFVSATPGGSAGWRLWVGDTTLAVNEVTGEVIFLAGDRADGPAPSGPAFRDPALEVERIANALGTPANITPTPGYLPAFRGIEAAARLSTLASWRPSQDRQSAFIFPRYSAPSSQSVTLYDTDEFAVLTSRLGVAAFVHRPLGTLRDPAIYPITTFAQALAELTKDPGRYLRLLSGPADDFLRLSINPATVVIGHAWANVFPGDLRRAGRTLVPVWVFPAGGFATDGTPVQALFTVDAVVPEMRAPQASGALATSADGLLRAQLTGGRFADPQVVASDFLGPGCAGLQLDRVDADSFAGRSTCNGARVDFKVSKAFPGYDSSVWYVSEPTK